ncbi:MAG: hypothetical protein ACI4E2_06950, partial [Acetatifactor sp.]
YVVMMDYGKYDVEKLEKRKEEGIDGIRLAFHKKDYLLAIKAGKKIIDKGYKLFMQPMITIRYSDRELLDLIDCVNKELPEAEAFFIVDSFGEMVRSDVDRIWNILDHNLNSNIQVGFHSHNNLQLSYSNALEFIQISGNREIIIDSSIMGMGKGAGNLNTELVLQHLNRLTKKKYNVAPILEVMDKVINQLHGEYRWGYAPEYYLSAINGCSPTYASYFYDKHMLPIENVNELLGRMKEEKKISFDADYAEKLYRKYNEEKVVDDSAFVQQFAKEIGGRDVLLVAPGKSIEFNDHIIKENLLNKKEIFSVGLNILRDYDFNYVMVTRADVYEKLAEKKDIIITSNVRKIGRRMTNVLNYANWIVDNNKIYDSSFVIMMNLLETCNVKRVFLAGFDGFSNNINENYYDPYLRHPLKENQVEEYNRFYKDFVMGFRKKGMEINFLTKSKYE